MGHYCTAYGWECSGFGLSGLRSLVHIAYSCSVQVMGLADSLFTCGPHDAQVKMESQLNLPGVRLLPRHAEYWRQSSNIHEQDPNRPIQG